MVGLNLEGGHQAIGHFQSKLASYPLALLHHIAWRHSLQALPGGAADIPQQFWHLFVRVEGKHKGKI